LKAAIVKCKVPNIDNKGCANTDHFAT